MRVRGALLVLTLLSAACGTPSLTAPTPTRYGDTIPPDELVGDPNQVVERAINWLQSGG